MTDITEVLCAVITLVFACVSAFALPWLKNKAGASGLERIRQWAAIAVAAAEQIYRGPGRGAEKKRYVIDLLRARGIMVDPDALEAVIEAEVGRFSA